MSGAWDAYDLKASWVAVFILFLLWWLSMVPGILFGDGSGHSPKTGDEEGDGGGGSGSGTMEVTGIEGKHRRWKRVARHFREGTLWLLASIALAFAAAAPPGATNALAWVFTGLWIILGILMFFIKTPRVMNLLAFLFLILLVALISNAFAHSGGRTSLVLSQA